MKIVVCLTLALGISGSLAIDSRAAQKHRQPSKSEDPPTYEEEPRRAPTPLETLAAKTASSAAKARAAAAAATGIAGHIETLAATGSASEAAYKAEQAERGAQEFLQESKDALSDVLRMSEDSANAVKVAKQSVTVGEEATADIAKRAEASLGRQLDFQLATRYNQFMEWKARLSMAGFN
eukprot:TRINITY_DN28290_c0_g1_i1.p1 TRINITY_DN28290_c0_g1~~TRINITY_DN28290_c0_g1_i1.p1  ORF type:complete len:180 (-),score=45.41 TRINITY_DN28290_c0_g1_i1:313-852(-)